MGTREAKKEKQSIEGAERKNRKGTGRRKETVKRRQEEQKGD
jgi:hypothetical protein